MNIIITSDTEKVLVPSTLRYLDLVAMEWSNSILTTQVPNLGCLHTCRLLTSMITGQVAYVLRNVCELATHVPAPAPHPWYAIYVVRSDPIRDPSFAAGRPAKFARAIQRFCAMRIYAHSMHRKSITVLS